MVGKEDFLRLLHELAEGQYDSIDSERWCELKGVDPDALHFVINSLIEGSRQQFDKGIEAAEQKIQEMEVSPDDNPIVEVGIGINLTAIIGVAVFNAFVLGWEGAAQFAPRTMLSELPDD